MDKNSEQINSKNLNSGPKLGEEQKKQNNISDKDMMKSAIESKLADLDDLDFDWTPRAPLTKEENEELIKFFETHPLFMKNIPENYQDNPHISALQNILHDDTPENLAIHFNKQGNELYQNGENKHYFLKESLKCYTEGIEQNCSDIDTNAKLHNNRALINIQFKNYGRAIQDCRKAFELNPNFTQAYYRCAEACLAVFRNDEAKDMLVAALKIEPDNNDIQKLLADTETQINKEKQKNSKQKQDVANFQSELHKKCIDKLVYLGKPVTEIGDAIKKSIYLDEKKKLVFPIMIYYLEFMTTDYIEQTQEDDQLINHLETLFSEGLPWDKDNNYQNIDDLEVYIQLNCTKSLFFIKNIQQWESTQGYQQVDPTQSILSIFTTSGYVIPMIPQITIVSKKSQFYDHFIQSSDIVKDKQK